MPPASKKFKSKSSRFPVARIKKIMQMDEEVGKLASATPVMISKSLECFLQNLVDECSSSVQSRGSKKITPHHLKSTITSQPNFDFLLSLVENIADPTPGPSGEGTKRKRTSKKKSIKDEDGFGEEDEGPEGVPGPTDSGAQPKVLPQIGTWKQDMEGGGGRGEGGKGMFDDYEEDEDDY